MKGSRSITATAIAVGLLAGSVVGVADVTRAVLAARGRPVELECECGLGLAWMPGSGGEAHPAAWRLGLPLLDKG
jgi:hypothetical protein